MVITTTSATSPGNSSTAAPAKSHIILETFESWPFCIHCFLTLVTYRFPLQPYISLSSVSISSLKLTPAFSHVVRKSLRSCLYQFTRSIKTQIVHIHRYIPLFHVNVCSIKLSPQNGEGSLPRFYVGHSIYKGKAALTIEPRAPKFVALESGAFKLSKEGFLLLQFAPAVGVRQYDWSRKQVFSLSVTEICNLISLGPKESCEFFDDPNKRKGSDEGKVRKVLKVEPLPDGFGRFFNLSVQNKLLNVDESVYIPITKAEFAVLISAFNFILQAPSNQKTLTVLTMRRPLSMEETTNGVDD